MSSSNLPTSSYSLLVRSKYSQSFILQCLFPQFESMFLDVSLHSTTYFAHIPQKPFPQALHITLWNFHTLNTKDPVFLHSKLVNICWYAKMAHTINFPTMFQNSKVSYYHSGVSGLEKCSATMKKPILIWLRILIKWPRIYIYRTICSCVAQRRLILIK